MDQIGSAVTTVVFGIVLTGFGSSGVGTVTSACANAIQFMYLGTSVICAILNRAIFCLTKLAGKTVKR